MHRFRRRAAQLIESEGDLLISDRSFEIRKWNVDQPREAVPVGQFAIVCCLTGNLSCAKASFTSGEIFLIPAHLEDRHLKPLAPDTSLLRVTILKTNGLKLDRIPLDDLPIFDGSSSFSAAIVRPEA